MGFLCCCPDPVDFDAEVNLFQFELHRAVGKGAFGKVCLSVAFVVSPVDHMVSQVRVVEHKRSKKLYALKYIDKQKCVKQKAVANIIQERQLLEEVRVNQSTPGATLWLMN
jgi:serine/threonine kinase 32